MECNKDEAIRAKEIALKKMQNNDFDGARRIALKAQQLFPDLENISHLIAACNVHCSAESKLLGSEKDWYSILQVERLADDATIKKQYRKLALLLHPDKNKFPGAEAAFKLVGEAHLVLSDRGKRSLYDSKLGISIKAAQPKPPTQRMNRGSSVKKQQRFPRSTSNHSSNLVNGLKQTTQSNPSFGQESFWTCCPFCNIKYQYFKSYVNRALRCQKCTKPFIAYDIAAQGVPPRTNRSQPAAQEVPQSTYQSQAATQNVPTGSNWRQPAFFKQKEIPVSGSHKSSTRETAGFPASSSVFQGAATSRKVESDSGRKETAGFPAFSSGFQGTATNSKVELDSGTQMRTTVGVGSRFGTQNSSSSVGGKGEDVPPSDLADAKPGEETSVIGNKRKRGKKMEVNESCDNSSSSESEDMIVETVADLAANQGSGLNDFYECRRSSRQKHQVSYIESEGEDEDLENPEKKSQEGKSFAEKAAQECTKDAVDTDCPLKQEKSDPSKGRTPEGNNLNGKIQATVESAGGRENDVKRVEIVDDSDLDANSADEQDPVVFHCPDPEFNDFDRDREQNCFAANQFWACYGNADGMPRYYALIGKVCSPGFKLRITWLEPDPENENEINWVNSELPIGCGKYKRGESQLTTDRLTFSHQIVCDKGSKRGSFFVYPRKGETWALFKNWDAKWCTEPEKHESFKFEVAEVLSDFAKNVGIRVALLDKVRGFVSLFHRRSESSSGEFVIEPSEMLRFSHRIPSFKMTGTEKKGVPEGSFELDPASLPANPDGICSPLVDRDGKSLGAQGNSVGRDSPGVKNKSKMPVPLSSPKKSDDPFSKRGSSDEEDSVLRRSPRGLNTGNKEKKKVNASNLRGQGITADNLSGSEARSCKAEVLSGQAGVLDQEIHEASPKRRSGSSSSRPASCNVAQDMFHDFESDRSSGKFAEGQIWALYKPEDKLPKLYGQIRKVGYGPFMLHVVMYEECPVTKKGVKPVCGAFKLQSGRSRTFEPSCFSHLMDPVIINKNRIEVYPKEGQVWAVYKNWNAKFSSSDVENCEYDIVLIVGNSNGHIKASPLVALKGYKSVYRSPRSRSSIGSMDIVVESELGRFSHQIPAFQLTTEKGGSLVGCWELDHAVVPSK